VTIAGNRAVGGSGIFSNSRANRVFASGVILANDPANANCTLPARRPPVTSRAHPTPNQK
jgi:hypothetical protein